jgi:cobyrinic acid a,c-diamide synthase
MTHQTRGVVIAGTQSGVGKTTITLGLLSALARRGLVVQPFKVGPDFIDPGHHTRAAGRLSRNLDGWMLSRAANEALFRRQARRADVAVVEGVMGLFDGYDGASEAGSTAQMAKWLNLPVLLVVDARAMARSAAALVHGFASFDPALTLAGVVFNRVGSATHLEYLRQALTSLPGVRCFGGLPRDRELAIPERHLGLTTAEDHPLDEAYLNHLADWLETHLDLDGLLQALPTLTLPEEPAPADVPPAVRLGVARDGAFCFYYPENLELLEHFGAQLVPFSPLKDRELPPDLHGVYLGGGYPELSAEGLAANQSLRQALREAAAAGLPIYAECGGLMYLSREIRDLEGRVHPMAGVFPFAVQMLARLKALGYREVTLTAPGLLGPAGTTVRGHEFHYSEMVGEPDGVPRLYRLTARQGGAAVAEGYCSKNVLASYVHLHFGSNPELARHLVASCRAYKDGLREKARGASPSPNESKAHFHPKGAKPYAYRP